MTLKLRRIFLAGILTAIPVFITVEIIQFLFRVTDQILAPLIERIVGFHIPGLGLITMILSIFVLGLFVTNFLGRRLIALFERLLLKVPFVSGIYNTSKQIVQTFSPENRKAFKKVVWLQYPRKEVWSLGFVTGTSASKDGIPYYNIFIATTPNPTSGFVIFVPQADTIDSNMPIEDGFKLLITGGMLSAEQHQFIHDPLAQKKSLKASGEQ